MIKDYYRLLGLPRNAALAEIKQAYRKLAALHHPDRVAAQGKEALAEATAKMMELNEAFKILSNPELKAEYDLQLELIPERPLPRTPPSAPRTPRPEVAADSAPKTPASPSSAQKPSPEVAAPQPPRPAPPVASAATAAAGPKPRPEPRLDTDYGARLKAALSRMSLKWTEQPLRGWEWTFESTQLRRAVLILYRTTENLSLLSARALLTSLEGLREERKSPLRKTTLLAVIHVGRMMDAAAVREQLQRPGASTTGLLGQVQSLVVLREGKDRPVLFGSLADDEQVAEVVRTVLGVN